MQPHTPDMLSDHTPQFGEGMPLVELPPPLPPARARLFGAIMRKGLGKGPISAHFETVQLEQDGPMHGPAFPIEPAEVEVASTVVSDSFANRPVASPEAALPAPVIEAPRMLAPELKSRLMGVASRLRERFATPHGRRVASMFVATSLLAQSMTPTGQTRYDGFSIKNPDAPATTPANRTDTVLRSVRPLPQSETAQENSPTIVIEEYQKEQSPAVVIPDINVVDAESMRRAEALVEELPALKIGAFCGPLSEDLAGREGQVAPETVIDGLGITELHPACAYNGRDSIYAPHNEVDATGKPVIQHNKDLLKLMEGRGQYFVDDIRFLSGDEAQVAAAFEDYKDHFGKELQIELLDEAHPEQVDSQIAALKVVDSVMQRMFPESGLRVKDLIRPSFQVDIHFIENIQKFQDQLGVDRVAFDAYHLPAVRSTLDLIKKSFVNPPKVGVYMQVSYWDNIDTGATDSTPVTEESLTQWHELITAARHDYKFVDNVSYFTGFQARKNLLNMQFAGNIGDPGTFQVLQYMKERYGLTDTLIAEKEVPETKDGQLVGTGVH